LHYYIRAAMTLFPLLPAVVAAAAAEQLTAEVVMEEEDDDAYEPNRYSPNSAKNRCRLNVYFYSQQPQHEQKVASRMGNVEKKSGPRHR
jgi:hypothetical protein